MKKNYLLFLFCIQLVFLYAQEVPKLDDFGRISLNPYVSEQSKLPTEAKAQLEIKLMQIASNYGMAGSVANPRFIITANISITTKDIVAGPPQQIAQNMDITLFIGDAIENKIFSNIVITSSGVGTNENKAFIDAVKSINTKNEKIENFIKEAKSKIISFYSTQCSFNIEHAENLATNQKYDEAIYLLSQIPEVCTDCFSRANLKLNSIYNKKINNESSTNLLTAKSIWASNPTEQGAQEASNYLMQINPQADCYSDAIILMRAMIKKLILDEKERLRKEEEYEKRQQKIDAENAKTEAELEKQRINAYREVAVEYAKNQTQVVYRNIYWY
jgi:hypothetical protein